MHERPSQNNDNNAPPAAVTVPPACEAAFEDLAFKAHVETIAVLTTPSWDDFTPSDSTIFWFHEVEEGFCAFLYDSGRVIAARVLSQAPKLSFGVFGWMIPPEANFPDILVQAGVAETWLQPEEWRDMAAEHGLSRGVVFPVESTFSEATRLQLTLHEAFHVNVQADVWFELGEGQPWMSWADLLSADRNETNGCYEGYRPEIEALASGVDGSCEAARAYLRLREERRATVADREVPSIGGDHVSCTVAEQVWEAAEGLADWTRLGVMHRDGVITNAELTDYILAIPSDFFYRPGLGKMVWMSQAGADIDAIVTDVAFLAPAA